MKNLMEVVKEATNFIREKNTGEKPFSEDEIKLFSEHIKKTYSRQSFWFKIKHNFESYMQLARLDLQYNFIGGAILKDKGDTIIDIPTKQK